MVKKFTQKILIFLLHLSIQMNSMVLCRSVGCGQAKVFCGSKRFPEGQDSIPFIGSGDYQMHFQEVHYHYLPFRNLTSGPWMREVCQLGVSDFSSSMSQGAGIFTIVDPVEDFSDPCLNDFAGLKTFFHLLNEVYGSIPKLVGIHGERAWNNPKISHSWTFHELQNALEKLCQSEKTDCIFISSSTTSKTTKEPASPKNENHKVFVGKLMGKGGPTCKIFMGTDGPTSNSSASMMAIILFAFGWLLVCTLVMVGLCLWGSFILWIYQRRKDKHAILLQATKDVLDKIPVRFLNSGDAVVGMDCVVCIEAYVCGDVVRILPCKHIFHKICIDFWLLDRRTCPLCKANILTAFGYDICDVEEGGFWNDSFYDEDEGRQSVNQLASPTPPGARTVSTDLAASIEAFKKEQIQSKSNQSSTKSICGSLGGNCDARLIPGSGPISQCTIKSYDTEVYDLSRCSSPSSTVSQSVDTSEMPQAGLCWCEKLTATSLSIRYDGQRPIVYLQEITQDETNVAGHSDSYVTLESEDL